MKHRPSAYIVTMVHLCTVQIAWENRTGMLLELMSVGESDTRGREREIER